MGVVERKILLMFYSFYTQLLDFVRVIIDEMLKGNFSFLILIVGVLQLIEMKKKNKRL